MSNSVAIIGECMLQLTQMDAAEEAASFPLNMGFGGDTLNTAIYLSRLGISNSYISALGDDPLSTWLLDEWQREGIDCSLIERESNSVPGMYFIDVADDGERSFYYWRDNSPAKRVFDDGARAEALFAAISKFSHLYLSGISLAILTPVSRQRLFDYLAEYRAQGGIIVYDGNYRPGLWGDVDVAQEAYRAMYRLTDIALPTLEDESLLFGYETAEQVIAATRELGVKEVVVKMGCDGCLSYSGSGTIYVEAKPTDPLDTTAAGDSFNAGYLSKRLTGGDVKEACIAGHSLASRVIQFRGAIIPADKF